MYRISLIIHCKLLDGSSLSFSFIMCGSEIQDGHRHHYGTWL